MFFRLGLEDMTHIIIIKSDLVVLLKKREKKKKKSNEFVHTIILM